MRLSMGIRTASGDGYCRMTVARSRKLIAGLRSCLVIQEGDLPPRLRPLRPRVTSDLSEVRPTDDVVICCTERPGADVARLQKMMGPEMPAVLAAPWAFNPQDVVTAFDAGVTGYLVRSQSPDSYLTGAAFYTARGQSCLSPAATGALLRHVDHGRLPAPAAPTPTATFTPYERNIMELMVTGHTITEIADHLTLTGRTVRNHLSNIYAKLNVRRQSEAILLWLGGSAEAGAADPGREVPRATEARQLEPPVGLAGWQAMLGAAATR